MTKLNLPKTIKMVITDFDGVMTDNNVYISEDYKTTRRVNFRDIMGIYNLKKNNIEVAIISGDKCAAIDVVAKNIGLNEVYQNIRVKIDVLKSILKKYSLSQEEYVYIGDEIIDFECLEYAKYKVTVPQAHKKIKEIAGIQITDSPAGEGAIREVADCLTD
jgi:YrbI family 3-deoxy-D-manno-octulosonate 8-phosphate phosphatase